MSRLLYLKNIFSKSSLIRENLQICATIQVRKTTCYASDGALILGVYTKDLGDGGTQINLTNTALKFNDKTNNRLLEFMVYASPAPLKGEVRILYGVDMTYRVIAMVGLGEECVGYNIKEQIDDKKEAIRIAVGAGIRALQALKVPKVFVESCGHAESAAEGASLASWCYQELRDKRKLKFSVPSLQLFDSCDWAGWQIGLHKASAQNLARHLMETPANLLTPSSFAQSAVEILSKHAINVEVRMHSWAKLRNMNAFLAAGMGSCEQPVFLEILYEGCDPDICPIVLIGKGVTFDSGGICLKKCHDLKHQRGDMASAAAVVATFRAIAALQLPINVRGLIPLCVNSFGATAMKPGDTVKAMNGKTIKIQNTDHSEGVLMVADALSYAKFFNPKFIVDVGTMTPGAYAAMGSAASLVFTNNESLYETIRIASIHTGDRIWRFPLWKYFSDYVHQTASADITNLAVPNIGGEPGRAAAFLREFVPDNKDWMHIETYNLTRTSGKPFSYLRKGMAGRPTRTIIEFLAQLCCKDVIEDAKKAKKAISLKNNKKDKKIVSKAKNKG